MDEEEVDLMKILGSQGTRKILEYLNTHDTGRYMNFKGFAATYTINTRLKELLKLELIKHHVVRVERKKEWYTITEKGKKICEYMEEMVNVVRK